MYCRRSFLRSVSRVSFFLHNFLVYAKKLEIVLEFEPLQITQLGSMHPLGPTAQQLRLLRSSRANLRGLKMHHLARHLRDSRPSGLLQERLPAMLWPSRQMLLPCTSSDKLRTSTLVALLQHVIYKEKPSCSTEALKLFRRTSPRQKTPSLSSAAPARVSDYPLEQEKTSTI